jgi:RHS repeat-associated protein
VLRYASQPATTGLRFTGQRMEGIGLYDYGARWFDAYLNRWCQPDDIIPDPGNPIDLDRYAYARNNPLRFADPSGHWSEDQLNESLGKGWRDKYFGSKAVFENRKKLLEFLLSKNTTDSITLEIVRSLFNVAYGAHNHGADFQGIDALGSRVAISGGGAGFGGFSIDTVLNLTSGEFSVFGAPEGGFVIGGTATLVGGITLYKNLPTNEGFRGTSKGVGLMGGDLAGINVEKSWGGIHYFEDASDVFNGSFLGVGGSVPEPNIGLYGSLSYSFEALRVDKAGYEWFPRFPGPIDIISDVGEVLWHDILKFH